MEHFLQINVPFFKAPTKCKTSIFIFMEICLQSSKGFGCLSDIRLGIINAKLIKTIDSFSYLEFFSNAPFNQTLFYFIFVYPNPLFIRFFSLTTWDSPTNEFSLFYCCCTDLT